MSAELAIGIVQTPFGLKGELKVRSLSGETAHFLKLKGQSVILRQAVAGKTGPALPARIIENIRLQEPSILIKFKGIDTPEDARKLTGCEILVERDRASKTQKDEYYVVDLIGCSLVFEGAILGTVLNVWETGAHDMLELRITDSAEESGYRIANVPFQAPFIGYVNIETKVIELLTPWVLE